MAPLELFEHADRAIARRADDVWLHNPGEGWRAAQHLARRLSAVALPLEPEAFARHFPEAARTPLPAPVVPQRARLFRFMSHH